MAINGFASGLDLGVNTPTINLQNANLAANINNNTSVAFDQNTNLVPGVPNPSQAEEQTQTTNSGGNAPQPKKVSTDIIKARILQPSLTSHFECYFAPPPPPCAAFIKQGVPDVDVEIHLLVLPVTPGPDQV